MIPSRCTPPPPLKCSFAAATCAHTEFIRSSCSLFSFFLRLQRKGKDMANYHYIPNEFTDIYQVKDALNAAGLEVANLIVGVDFTKSNEWTGKHSFDGLSLHTNSPQIPNPYQCAIYIIGTALLGYDDDKKIPCFGFGDATTHDQKVFSFYRDGRPCQGIEGVLSRYEQLLPYITLSGPTSFAPLIYTAIDVVRQSGNQFHILVIIADGQVTGNIGFNRGRLSPQEKETIDAIVSASNFPLSILMVGVGDGPWNMMHFFDDAIPRRKFDNFQFVNYTQIMAKYQDRAVREAAFALEALMEIPKQYTAIKHLQGVSSPYLKGHNSYVLPPPIPQHCESNNMVQRNSLQLPGIASPHGTGRNALQLPGIESPHGMGRNVLQWPGIESPRGMGRNPFELPRSESPFGRGQNGTGVSSNVKVRKRSSGSALVPASYRVR